MVIYLQSRLGSLDEQINTIMSKQKASEGARKALQGIQNEIANIGDEGGAVDVEAFAKSLNEVAAHMGEKAAAELFSNLPEAVRSELVLTAPRDGAPAPSLSAYTLSKDSDANATLGKQDLGAVKTYLENAIKDVESGSELEMIKLQSLMSARNTAISLATNMTSAIGKGAEAIVGNIGR
jgi:hypothetical protein